MIILFQNIIIRIIMITILYL